MGGDLPEATDTLARVDPDAEQAYYAIMLNPLADDPYAGYHQLRAKAPALLTSDGSLVLTRYADCDAALRHRALGKAEEMVRVQVTDIPAEKLRPVMERMQQSMMMANPPKHTRLRGLAGSAFTGGHVEALRDAVIRRTDQYLDELAASPGGDFMTILALPQPYNVIADLLGVPESDRNALAPKVDDYSLLTDPAIDAEGLARGIAAEAELAAYFAGLLADKRARPADDLLSRLAEAQAGDTLTETETISTAMLLFGAGIKTTANLLGNGLHALLSHPDQFKRLRDDRDLIPTAVDEQLRYDSPVQFDARGVLEPVSFLGADLRPGQTVITILGAANHDPARFDDPGRFDVGRTGNSHLSFASGIHFCLGAHLTRLEAEVFLARLLDRGEISAADVPQRSPGSGLRGFARLPVTLHP